MMTERKSGQRLIADHFADGRIRVRFAPKATVGRQNAIRRYGPILLKKAAVATHDIH